MGRVQQSTAFGIDGPRRTTNAKYPEPPLYVEAPFDFDSDLDAPDTVYEAFLTLDELEARNTANAVNRSDLMTPPNARALLGGGRDATASPFDSDESSSVTATTQPPTRAPSPIREDRGGAASPTQRSASPVGSGILQLMEPLTLARNQAMPVVSAVLADTTPIGALSLVTSLYSIIRPHITTAIAPFLRDIPDVEYFGHMFERSLVLELLSGRFSRPTIMTALDAVEETYRSVVPTVEITEEVISISESEFDLSDDFPSSDIGSESRSSSPGSWLTRSAQPSPTLQHSNVDPALIPTAPSARPQAMDVDTDDDAHSITSSSGPPSTASTGPRYSMQSGIRNFTPRVWRARDTPVRPQVIIDERPGSNYHPVYQQRVLAPMR